MQYYMAREGIREIRASKSKVNTDSDRVTTRRGHGSLWEMCDKREDSATEDSKVQMQNGEDKESRDRLERCPAAKAGRRTSTGREPGE